MALARYGSLLPQPPSGGFLFASLPPLSHSDAPPPYAQQENSERLRKSSREKIAAALGITQKQLDF